MIKTMSIEARILPSSSKAIHRGSMTTVIELLHRNPAALRCGRGAVNSILAPGLYDCKQTLESAGTNQEGEPHVGAHHDSLSI